MAGIAAGADGLMVEVHVHPRQALSDGMQSLKPERFAQLVNKISVLCSALGRSVAELEHIPTREKGGSEELL